MSKIEWCDITLNPIVGCSKCSPGCANCYAEKFAARLAKNPNPKIAAKYAGVVDNNGHWTGNINEEGWECLDRLPERPVRVFLGSMTDLFHENAPEATIKSIFDYIEYRWPQHTFLLLTKRPDNAKTIIEKMLLPKNVWLGVTVCNQQEVDEKIPILLEIPAAKRFVSVEPMLGPVNLTPYLSLQKDLYSGDDTSGFIDYEQLLSWVICGGETGPGARPIHSDWVKGLRDQCIDAGVPFFFKSWGEWWPCSQIPDDFDCSKYPVGDIGDDGIFIPPPALEIPLRNGVCSEQTFKVGKKLSGHLIDGEEYREFPG